MKALIGPFSLAELRESLDRAQRDRDAYYSAMDRAVRELESSGGATANQISRDLRVAMDRPVIK